MAVAAMVVVNPFAGTGNVCHCPAKETPGMNGLQQRGQGLA